MPLLDIRDLAYTAPEPHSFRLQNIHLSLEEGKILAIVGESGSGKTTLLRLIAGLLDAEAGDIFLDGEQVTGPANNLVPGHPAIQMLFQHFGLSPKINVYQNIAYLLKAYPSQERHNRTQELLTFCKLTGLEERFPHELSGGEKQRLALARALADYPLLLLMDEPFSHMDTILKNQLKEDILDILKDTHTTSIIVTHDMHDALSVADQIAVMQEGKIIQTGTPEQIYYQPEHPYVAQLFGVCNFLSIQQAACLLMDVKPGTHTLCIRAEHIHLGASTSDSCQGFVVHKHFMGSHFEIAVKVEEALLVLYTKESHVQEGDPVYLHIEKEKVIYFS